MGARTAIDASDEINLTGGSILFTGDSFNLVTKDLTLETPGFFDETVKFQGDDIDVTSTDPNDDLNLNGGDVVITGAFRRRKRHSPPF